MGTTAASVTPRPIATDQGADLRVPQLALRDRDDSQHAAGEPAGAFSDSGVTHAQPNGVGKVVQRPISSMPSTGPGVRGLAQWQGPIEIPTPNEIADMARIASVESGSVENSFPHEGVLSPTGTIHESLRQHSFGMGLPLNSELFNRGGHTLPKTFREPVARVHSQSETTARNHKDPQGIGNAGARKLQKATSHFLSEGPTSSGVASDVAPPLPGRPLDRTRVEDRTVSNASHLISRSGSACELVQNGSGSYGDRGMKPAAALASPRGSGGLSAGGRSREPSLSRPHLADWRALGASPAGLLSPQLAGQAHRNLKQQADWDGLSRRGSTTERGHSAGPVHAHAPRQDFGGHAAAREKAEPEQREGRRDGHPPESVPGPIAAAILAYSRRRQSPIAY